MIVVSTILRNGTPTNSNFGSSEFLMVEGLDNLDQPDLPRHLFSIKKNLNKNKEDPEGLEHFNV